MNNSNPTPSEKNASGESHMTRLVNWVLRLIPTLIVGQAAWMKFANDPQTSKLFEALDMEPGGRVLIGLIEALCVVLLLSPRLSSWGAILCLGVMSGAIIAHTTVLGFSGSAGLLFGMAIVSGAASLALIYRLRRQVPFIRSMFER